MKTISEKLKRTRKRRGMSQAKFAAYIGVPIKTLQQWEQGIRQPRGLSLGALERFMT